MKESGLRIRVDKGLRQRFVETCRAQDVTASQVLRHFMRQYVDEAEADRQPDFFESMVSGGEVSPQ